MSGSNRSPRSWRHAAEVGAYLIFLFLAALMWAMELTS